MMLAAHHDGVTVNAQQNLSPHRSKDAPRRRRWRSPHHQRYILLAFGCSALQCISLYLLPRIRMALQHGLLRLVIQKEHPAALPATAAALLAAVSPVVDVVCGFPAPPAAAPARSSGPRSAVHGTHGLRATPDERLH